MTGPDPARATADAIADRLTSTILARYQGDSMTKQADPNGRTPIGPLPAALGDYKPPLYVQAMLETATAEGRAEALAEQLSDLSLDRMALVDRLVDREREAATVIVDLHVANARAVDDATQARALLSSATARADQLEAELDSDPRRAVLQTIWDTATTAITAIGGSNLDDIDTAGRVELLAERAIELYAENRHDIDGERDQLYEITGGAIEAHHAARFAGQDIGTPTSLVDRVRSLALWLAHERQNAVMLDQIEDEARDIAADALVEHHREMSLDNTPAAVPNGLVDLVGALRATLRHTRSRVAQLEAANVALQDTANGRHSVVGGEVREHTEQAPTGGVEVGRPYEQTLPETDMPEHVTQAIDTVQDAIATTARECQNCGHGRDKHDPGAYWNADQRAIHRSCEPPCPCTVYVPVAPKPS
ncbi:hypothetical protein KNU20_gp69 [Gordonia phage Geodirt]|uniref:Uncharacterized protein n=1 Tax=Gordonia phage Geodirt TaxID=2483670 RepID=A0A3G3M8X1_9CAUD|nr:hypothetical protein KNU20_gp69 [Gordonia phage Geodirt]AYR02962.1 hypothetical protein SEA_GEODIRT_69 [Gordonia phage Geodirt]